MTSVTLPGSGGTVSFKYDPFGRRIYKSSSSGTSVYAYDGDNLIEETNASGGVVARYEQTQNIDEPLAMLRSSATSYFHADGLGSITSLSNSAGTLANTYTYDSYGNLTASTGSLVNSFRYTGRESDAETGLYYYRARYYDPTVGRFVSSDPIGFGGMTSNFYAYVANDPQDSWDPLGLRALTKCEKRNLAPYIPRIDLDNADIRENEWPPKIGKFFPIPLSKDVAAITLGNKIYIRPGEYDPTTIDGEALLGHELVHVGQYRTGEMTRAGYLNELIKHGSGTQNKYEAPAYGLEDEIKFSLPALLRAFGDKGPGCGCEQ